MKMHKERRAMLHAQELPVANLTTQFLSTKIDPKKGRRVKLSDMCFFADAGDFTKASPLYGACMGAAIRAKVFPGFAYFIYPELKSTMDKTPPAMPVLYAKDMIILAPEIQGNKVAGLVVCEADRKDKIKTLRSLDGQEYRVRMPEHKNKHGVWASDDYVLELIT